MLVEYFCCCYHLRTGTIVLAWLQIMANVILIAGLAAPQPFLVRQIDNILPKNLTMFASIGITVLIGELCIKSAICFTLIWGVIQRNHFFMQPWIFLQFVENVVITLAFLGLFITACFYPIVFVAVLFVLITGILNWYFWASVKTVYNADYKASIEVWGEFTDENEINYRHSVSHQASMRRPENFQRQYPGLPRVN